MLSRPPWRIKNTPKSQRYLVKIKRSMGGCFSLLVCGRGVLNFERQKIGKKSTNKWDVSLTIAHRMSQAWSPERRKQDIHTVFCVHEHETPPTPSLRAATCGQWLSQAHTESVERWTLRGDECWSGILIFLIHQFEKIKVHHNRSKGGM